MGNDISFSMLLSIKVAVTSVAILVLISLPLAWKLARTSFPGKRILEAILILPMVLPPTVLGYYLVILLGRNGIIGKLLYQATGWTVIFSWWGAVIAAAVVAFPLLFQTTYLAIGLIDPELEQIAYIEGASKFQTFWYVTLPLAKRGIMSGIALALARSMGEFGATLMLAGNVPGKTVTMSMAVYNAFSAGDYAQANILVLVYTVVSLAVLAYVMSGGLKKSFGLAP